MDEWLIPDCQGKYLAHGKTFLQKRSYFNTALPGTVCKPDHMKALQPGIIYASPFRLLTWTVLLFFLASTLGCHVFRKKKRARYRMSGVSSSPRMPNFSIAKKRTSSAFHYSNSSVYISSNEPADAGVLTSGELNDFAKWELWEDLSNTTLSTYAKTWKLKPEERYTVQVTNEHAKPMVNLAVQLLDVNGKVIWRAMTDNTGKAELWANSIKTNDKNKNKRKLKDKKKL